MPFSEKSLAVPSVAIILNPNSLKSRAKEIALILSDSELLILQINIQLYEKFISRKHKHYEGTGTYPSFLFTDRSCPVDQIKISIKVNYAVLHRGMVLIFMAS